MSRLVSNSDATQQWINDSLKDYWWKKEQNFSLTDLSIVLGIDQNTSRDNYPGFIRRLKTLIPKIEARKIIFFGGGNGVPFRGKPRFIWVEPPDHPPVITRISPQFSWSIWACCASCSGNKFLGVIINEKPHVACYKCLPPSQYPAIGARPSNVKLICDAAEKYCT